MRPYREQDFEKMANRVVEQFMAGKGNLAQVAAKEAMDSGLNPDQIERLAQTANTNAFLKMMDQKKQQGGNDLTGEFEPIDSRHIIKLIIDQNGVHVEPMDDGGGMPPQDPSAMEVPDEMSGMRMNPAEGAPGHMDTPEVEACEEECHEEKDPPGMKTKKKKDPAKKVAEVRRLQKLAGLLEDENRQAALSFEEKFNALTTRFKLARHSPQTFAAFEKDAMCEHNSIAGRVILNHLRQARGLEPVASEQLEKTASLAQFHVSDDSPELALFEQLVKLAEEVDQRRIAIEHVRTQCA